MKNKKRTIKSSIFIASILVILLSISYAFINMTVTGNKRQMIATGNLQIELEEEKELTLENAMPIYDEVGMIQDSFDFRLVNYGKQGASYVVKLVDITADEKLDTSIVKYGLTKEEQNRINYLSSIEDSVIDVGFIKENQIIHYSLRLWIDSSVEDEELIKDKSLKYRIEVELSNAEEIELDLAGGTSEETKSYIVHDQYTNLPAPTKEGYNFLGWYDEEDNLIVEGTDSKNRNSKLIAKWAIVTYTLTFNPNGGVVNPTSKQVEHGGTYGSLPTPTKTDYEFTGWYTASTGGTRVTESTNVNGDQTIYAQYTYKEAILNGTQPVLSSNLVPVNISNNGTVTKADTSKEWYRYKNQRWANAVVLVSKTNYSNGQTIPESNIQSYFVWIPRYKYQIFNTGNYTSLTSLSTTAVQTINLVFENKNTAISSGTTKNAWLTHPAFTSFNSNGFWVGKFESGYKGATTTAGAEVNSSDSTKLQIKPNIYSWRSLTVGNMFKVSYDYLRSDDSHMMKNTEWGAVAYLQHSVYGSNKKVRINNNSDHKTGYATVSESTCGYNDSASTTCNSYGIIASITNLYNTTAGYLASTTGNIDGIYDMSGGAYEYVMGYNMNAKKTGGESEIISLYSNFFTNNSWNKYYDKYYTSDTGKDFNKRILEDATGEMGPFAAGPISSWYENYSTFPDTERPWISRGGIYKDGTGAGIFMFHRWNGSANPVSADTSFRIVLTPQ